MLFKFISIYTKVMRQWCYPKFRTYPETSTNTILPPHSLQLQQSLTSQKCFTCNTYSENRQHLEHNRTPKHIENAIKEAQRMYRWDRCRTVAEQAITILVKKKRIKYKLNTSK